MNREVIGQWIVAGLAMVIVGACLWGLAQDWGSRTVAAFQLLGLSQAWAMTAVIALAGVVGAVIGGAFGAFVGWLGGRA